MQAAQAAGLVSALAAIGRPGRTRRVTAAQFDAADGDSVTLSAEARDEPPSQVELKEYMVEADRRRYRAAAKARAARDAAREVEQSDEKEEPGRG